MKRTEPGFVILDVGHNGNGNEFVNKFGNGNECENGNVFRIGNEFGNGNECENGNEFWEWE